MIKVGILTLSDRSFRKERDDLSGPALEKIVQEQGWLLEKTAILPDDYDEIKIKLILWSDKDRLDLILTTGGTGFATRDITPEATLAVVDRLALGLAEAMRAESLKITNHAMLSRAVAGIRKSSLIINLPGSPKAAVENLAVLLPVLPHAIQLLKDDPEAEASH